MCYNTLAQTLLNNWNKIILSFRHLGVIIVMQDGDNMFNSPITIVNNKTMKDAHAKIEEFLNADVLVYYGEIIDSAEQTIRNIIEDLQENRKDKLYIVLTTGGGSLNPVKRMVNIFRNFYNEVHFIVPDYAYSAGTVFCCSGDSILMSYYSVLGPIDPQVKNADGKFVAALGYLDKINDLIKKAQDNTLTNAEFIILKDFDLAELRTYEQARDLAIDLLVEWLPKYKFKDWTTHADGRPVTLQEKQNRAREIAENLSDNNEWKSHGRPINRDELQNLHLKIDNLDADPTLYRLIMDYHNLATDYIAKYNYQRFVQTRLFL